MAALIFSAENLSLFLSNNKKIKEKNVPVTLIQTINFEFNFFLCRHSKLSVS